MKQLSVKELKEKVSYGKKSVWSKKGCFSCSYSHEKLIMKNYRVKCGLHDFAFNDQSICSGFEERQR